MKPRLRRRLTGSALVGVALLWCLAAGSCRAQQTQAPPRQPKQLAYEKLVASSCGETTNGGGCTTNSYEGVQFSRKGTAVFYRKSVNHCIGGVGTDWTRAQEQRTVEERAYTLRADTFFIAGTKGRFFVRLNKAIYSEKFDFYSLVQ